MNYSTNYHPDFDDRTGEAGLPTRRGCIWRKNHEVTWLFNKHAAVICVFCFLQAAYYYPLLPERVPSHFGASGIPDA
jgi:hypothetical protein